MKITLSMSGAFATGRLTRSEVESIHRTIRAIVEVNSNQHQLAGSYRRGSTDIGDIDYIVTDCDINDLLEALQKKIKVVKVARKGEKLLTVVVKHKAKEIQMEFINVPDKSFGAALMHSTGSGKFNIGLRTYAKRKGYLMNQYGMFEGEKKVAGTTEEGMFKKLGLKFIPPEERESDFWSIKDNYKLK